MKLSIYLSYILHPQSSMILMLPHPIQHKSSYNMPSHTEDDPLLPRKQYSPEIKGSRPGSINDARHFTEIEVEDEADTAGQRRFRDSMTMVVGLCLIFSFIFIFFPQDSSPDGRPVPVTIDQRVERILTDTPLIGQRYILTLALCSRTTYTN